MKWAVAVVGLFIMFMAPILGSLVQPLAPFWLGQHTIDPGTIQLSLPGVVPVDALQAPAGPLLSESSALLHAIDPWIGVPYKFGGTSGSGVDCSGFTFRVEQALKVAIPRTAQTQYDATTRVTQPEVGDFVFFQHTYDSPDRITHVGIIVAPGMMVSAIVPAVGRQSLDSSFWRDHFAGYGRIKR